MLPAGGATVLREPLVAERLPLLNAQEPVPHRRRAPPRQGLSDPAPLAALRLEHAQNHAVLGRAPSRHVLVSHPRAGGHDDGHNL
eukprot:scaffold1681_cov105-Isochrysis_galbana.AAC.6